MALSATVAEWAEYRGFDRSDERDQIVAGAACHVSDGTRVYLDGTVVDVKKKTVEVRLEGGGEDEAAKGGGGGGGGGNGKTVSVPLSHVFAKANVGAEGVEDMVNMRNLHEPGLLANLQARFETHKIYTYVGSVLVSVNPYKSVPIYTPAIRRMYAGQPVGTLPPHVYALADAAYQSARGEGKNQSILISGESGAGKTEATKLIIAYLTEVSGRDKAQTKLKITPQERLLSTNPILEAFGNARTVRNNNSSRFAKMMDVEFDAQGYIVGGRIENYLLEKSRIVRQSKEERNFHSFYYLLAGCDKTERAVWGLYSAKHYHFTNQSRVYEIPGVNSKLQYTALKRAMTTGGITVHEQHLTFTLLAAVLHIGNVRFGEGASAGEAAIKNLEVVKWVAHLLKCDVKALTHALLFHTVQAGGEAVDVPLSVEGATNTRDTLAKELYSRSFDWIVRRLNEDMQAAAGSVRTVISLLDIFGFEQYETNAFEQFCINYANERLQYEFNEFIFKREKEAYLAERLDVSDFTFVDNQPALALIERSPGGLLGALDEQTRADKGTDARFLAEVAAMDEYTGSKARKRRVEENTFTLAHYAGEVVYDVRGFVSTNRERFSHSLMRAVKTSRVDHFVALFSDLDAESADAARGRPSLSAQFRTSLVSLMDKLGRAEPQYVRTIKPNGEQSSEIYDRHEMLRQVRCAGILETVRIRKEGFPHRRPVAEFLARFCVLRPGLGAADAVRAEREAAAGGCTDASKAQTRELLAAVGIDAALFRVGLTKVFVKDEVFHRLEGLRAAYFNRAAVRMQSHLKGHFHRRRYLRKLAATRLLQRTLRAYLDAVDVGDEVAEQLRQLDSGQGGEAASIRRLGSMAGRAANVDAIIQRGGVDKIAGALANAGTSVLVAGADALDRMARSTSDASTAVARSGAVTTMVKSLNVRRSAEEQPHAIRLLGNLSKEERNVGIVVREGGLQALTSALTQSTRVAVISDTNVSAAAMALGNLSRSHRVANAIGRDVEAVRAVIEGIDQKPKYARLTQYSINCLANMSQVRENVDALVELGGAQTLVTAMKNHHANEDVLHEVSRTFREAAKNPKHAKMIGELGAVELAVASVENDPAHCGRPALAIVESLVAHPANARRFVAGHGIRALLNVLRGNVQSEPVLSTAARVLESLCRDERILPDVAQLDGPRVVLDSLKSAEDYVAHNTHCMGCLTLLGALKSSGGGGGGGGGGGDGDGDGSGGGNAGPERAGELKVRRKLRGAGVVTAVAMAMERHANRPEAVAAGRAALEALADRQDTESAMDVVARSRMKAQTEKNHLATGRSVVVLGSMALLPGTVDYIISEGGTPVLLSVVNGTSVNVSAKVADQLLVPALRALSRLLVSDDNIEEFVAEGGVQSLVAAVRGQSDKERVCEVTTETISKLVESTAGFRELVTHEGLEALVSILHDHAEFEQVIITVLSLLTRICKSKAHGIRLLLEKGILLALTRVIQHHQGNVRVLLACAAILAVLSTNRRAPKGKILLCCEWLLNGVRANIADGALASATLRLAAKMSRDVEGIEYLQEKNTAEVLLAVLDEHYGDIELTTLATQVLTQLTGNKELKDALEYVERLTRIVVNPTAARGGGGGGGGDDDDDDDDAKADDDVNMSAQEEQTAAMSDMVAPSALIGAMSPDPGAATVLVEADGFRTIREAIHAVMGARQCVEQERVAKHLAVAAARLGQHRQHTKAVLFSGVLQELIRAAVHLVEYEEFVEECMQALDTMSRNQQATGYLIDIGAAKSATSIVAAHPLHDGILVSATRFTTRLARGADIENLPEIRKEGTALALIGVGRFMSAEQHLLDSLGALGRLAALHGDGSSVVLSKEAVAMLRKVMVRHRNSPVVVSAACQTFSALGEEEGFARAMAPSGIADELAGALDQYGDNEELVGRALAALCRAAEQPAGAAALRDRDVAAVAVEAMASHPKSDAVQSAGMRLLAALAADDDDSARAMAASGAVRVVFNGVRALPMNPAVVQHGIGFAHRIAMVKGNRETLEDERAKEMIEWAVRAYPQNGGLVDECRAAYALLVDSPGDVARLDELRDNTGADEDAGAAPEFSEEFHAQEAERIVRGLVSLMRVIKKPGSPDKALSQALVTLANARATHDTLGGVMKHGGLARVVALLDEKADTLPVLLPVLKVIMRLADQPAHVHQMVAFGGIGALLRVMRQHLDVPDVLAVGVRILGKLTVFNRLKILVGLYGGVPLVLEIMEKYVNIAPLLNKCAYCLGNLSSNCLPNRKAITEGGGVTLLSFTMQKHRSYLELVVNCARALSPLCAQDDEARLTVAKGGGSLVIIAAIQAHPDNPGLLQNGLNCLHKISKRADTLPTLIHQNAVQAVVAAMRQYADNVELQQFGMEVLSNLSACHTRETAVQLTKGGTVDAVVSLAVRHRAVDRVQVASFTCLQNLAAASPEDALRVVSAGFVAHVLDALAAGEPTEKMLEEGVQLLTVLASNSEDSARDIIDGGAPEVLVLVMRQCAAWREVMVRVLACLSKLSTNEEHARALAEKGCVVAVVEALLDRGDDSRYLTDVLRVLVNLAILEENAITISETAMAPLIKSVDDHFGSQPFLRMFFLLMNNVSMWPRASQHLVDQGMVPIILDTMKASVQLPGLIVRMIKTLTNFTMVGEEAKRLMTDEGALLAVQEILSTHRNHIQLAKAAETFVYKLSGVRRSKQVEEKKVDLATYVRKHVSEHARNLLTGGGVLRQYLEKGKVVRQLVRVTLDFRTIEWCDPRWRKGEPLSGSLPLKFVKDVRAGANTPNLLHHGLFSKATARPELSFSLADVRNTDPASQLSLEAETTKEQKMWVRALQQLKDAYTSYAVGL